MVWTWTPSSRSRSVRVSRSLRADPSAAVERRISPRVHPLAPNPPRQTNPPVVSGDPPRTFREPTHAARRRRTTPALGRRVRRRTFPKRLPGADDPSDPRAPDVGFVVVSVGGPPRVAERGVAVEAADEEESGIIAWSRVKRRAGQRRRHRVRLDAHLSPPSCRAVDAVRVVVVHLLFDEPSVVAVAAEDDDAVTSGTAAWRSLEEDAAELEAGPRERRGVVERGEGLGVGGDGQVGCGVRRRGS